MDVESALKNLMQKMHLKGYSSHTIKNYEYLIKRLIKFLNGREITEEGIRQFLLSLKEECSSNTIYTYASCIKNFLEFMNLDIDIVLPKTKEKLPECLTKAEIERLLNSIENERDLLIIRLLYATGMRVSELLTIEKGDIEENRIKIRKGKGKKERIVYVDNKTIQLLNPYIRRDGLIFTITARTIQLLVKKYVKKAGITKKVTPHTLRHTFATHLLENGASIEVIRDLLGHASLSTTQIYTHVTDRHKKETYERFHPLNRW